MTDPLVSIIIPTYNRAHLIGETLDSVLAQTYTHWECIIVDDGSTDDTDQVVREYLKKDPRFKYYHRPDTHKPGGNGARNYGFLQSKGEYIQWFDSDDIMYEDHLSLKVAVFLEDKDIDVVFCAYHYFDNNGIQNRISNNIYTGDILEDKLDKKVNFSTLSFMLQRKVLVNHFYDETIKKSQDLDFFFRLFSTNPGLKIQNVNIPLYKVRKHNKQISTKVSIDGIELKSKYWVYERIFEFYKMSKYLKGMQINKICLQVQLKLLLQNKNYSFVVFKILKSNYLNFRDKFFLILYVLIYILTGKGLYKIKSFN